MEIGDEPLGIVLFGTGEEVQYALPGLVGIVAEIAEIQTPQVLGMAVQKPPQNDEVHRPNKLRIYKLLQVFGHVVRPY